MNSEMYLQELYQRLGNMNQEQKEEIINDIREHFHHAMLNGKSFEEIYEALGSPEIIAAQFSDGYEPEKANFSSNLNAGFNAQTHPNKNIKNIEIDGEFSGYIDIHKVFDISEVKNISINMKIADLKISCSNSQSMEVKLSITGDTKDSTFSIFIENGTLYCKEDRKFNLSSFMNFHRNMQLTLELPQIFAGKLYAKTSAGNIRINGIGAQKLEAFSNAGWIKIEDSKGELNINTKAGDVNVNNFEGNMELRTAAGNIKLEHGTGDVEAFSTAGNVKIISGSGKIKAFTTAGNVKVESGDIYGLEAMSTAGNVHVNAVSITGGIKLTSSAGNVKLETKRVDGSVSVKTSLGNATLNLPSDARFNIISKISRGNSKCELQSFPDSPNTLEVSTSMGDVKIRAV